MILQPPKYKGSILPKAWKENGRLSETKFIDWLTSTPDGERVQFSEPYQEDQ